MADTITHIVRVLTEDGEVEAQESYGDIFPAEDGFEEMVAAYIDTESAFEYGEEVFTIQLIDFHSDSVLMETNSVIATRG